MDIFWDQYKKYGLEKPKFLPNIKIMNIDFSNFIWYSGDN